MMGPQCDKQPQLAVCHFDCGGTRFRLRGPVALGFYERHFGAAGVAARLRGGRCEHPSRAHPLAVFEGATELLVDNKMRGQRETR